MMDEETNAQNRFGHAHWYVVESVRKPAKVRWEADEIVAVAQFDRNKKNALPIAYAVLLGREMGIPVNSTVVQENIVSHTGADAPTRVLGQPIFDGAIGEGKRILIVDDVVTFGATLANLRGFIQSCGSVVVGASTLSASYGGTKLALPDHVKQSLFERFPSVAELAHGLGFEPDCFTNREARFLAALGLSFSINVVLKRAMLSVPADYVLSSLHLIHATFDRLAYPRNHLSKRQPSQTYSDQLSARCRLVWCLLRKKSHLGPAKATTAMARKLACIVYNLLKYKAQYREPDLLKQAATLGYKLLPNALVPA
jgi:hypothetical protein